MRPNGSIALAVLGLMLACAPAASAGGPRIISVDSGAPAVLDRPLELHVTAQPRGDQVQGLRVSFPDLGGVFAVSACRLGPATAGVAAGLPDVFAVPYRPSWTGLHLLELAVTSGGCGAPEGTSRRSLPIDVTAPELGANRAPTYVQDSAQASAPAGCAGADRLPLRPRLRSLRLTMVCLINAQRRAAGVPALRTSRSLRTVAVRHVHAMRAGGYVDHSGPADLDLRERLQRAGVRSAIAGENIGVGPGRLGTPASIVAAWMASDPLRRNLLDPTFGSVGVAALSTVPGVMNRSGGTYAVELAP